MSSDILITPLRLASLQIAGVVTPCMLKDLVKPLCWEVYHHQEHLVTYFLLPKLLTTHASIGEGQVSQGSICGKLGVYGVIP
jgi:hypothetical protein